MVDDKHRSRFMALIEQGYSIRECSEILDIPEKTLYTINAQYRGAKSTRYYTPTEKDILISNYRKLGNAELSQLLLDVGYERTPKAISKWLAKNGYKRPESTIKKLCRNKSKNLFMRKETNPSSNRSLQEGEMAIHTYTNNRKYWMLKKEGRLCHLHRVLWEEHHGPIPEGGRVMFVNGDSLDCRIDNLRLDTRYSVKPEGYKMLRSTKDKRKYWVIKKDGKWKRLHRVLWEEHHGPIPKGHKIAFIDGDSTNYRLDNLYLQKGFSDKARKAQMAYAQSRIRVKKKKSKQYNKDDKTAAKKAQAILNARKRKEKQESSVKKKKLSSKPTKTKNLTVEERNKRNMEQIKGKVRVIDKENRCTRWVTPDVYEKKYKNNPKFEV